MTNTALELDFLSGWFLIKSNPRVGEEQRAVANLAHQNFDPYCPMMPGYRGPTPIFPGYLFVQINNAADYQKVKNTRGVGQVIVFNRITRAAILKAKKPDYNSLLPRPIHNGDRIIQEVKTVEAILNQPEEAPVFEAGDPVTCPLFEAMKTTFVQYQGQDRGLVLIQYIENWRGPDGQVRNRVTAEKQVHVFIADLKPMIIPSRPTTPQPLKH